MSDEQKPSERMTDAERALWRAQRIMENKGRGWSKALAQAQDSLLRPTTTTTTTKQW